MSFKNKIISSILFLCLFENGTFHASENNNSVIEKQNVVMSAKNEKSNVEMMSEKTNVPKEPSSISRTILLASLSVTGLVLIFLASYVGGLTALRSRSLEK